MFNPITVPYGARMLFNTVKLRPGVAFEDVEIAVGEMCSVVNWRSFEEHEESHSDAVFAEKFGALAQMCSDSKELGYEMMWQGAA